MEQGKEMDGRKNQDTAEKSETIQKIVMVM